MKVEAEVDEFGVLCVTMRERSWWAEAAWSDPGGRYRLVRIDAENAPLERVRELEGAILGLREWCTNGGTAEWLTAPPTKS
jgi:hypothetical protein